MEKFLVSIIPRAINMATSKNCKKRPLSLSLSQTTGMESSKIRRKKKNSSQDCEFSDSTSKSMTSKVEDIPKRKLVEAWLENNTPDINVRSSIESPDENSQETVLLDVNSHPLNCDRTDGKEDLERLLQRENVVTKEEAGKQDIVRNKENVEEVVMEEVLEANPATKEIFQEELVESELGMCSKHVTQEEPLLQCPLCWKNFEKSQTQAAHLKACASANGLTTRQLIDAVELHKKQLAERRKLGLFPMAIPQIVSKKSAPKKMEGANSRKSRKPKDSELELALALSLSLAQREEKQESLNAFGFSSKSNGPKKSAPPLLTRTQAERERLITEKVSIVLLEESGGTQPSNNSQEVHPTVESLQLQEWCDEDQPLWKKSYFSPSQSDESAFYVSALGHVIAPSKTEVGANMRHISQLPGRLNTPKKNEQPKEKTGDDSSVSGCDSVTNTLSKLEQDVKAKHLNDWACMLKNSSMSDVSVYVHGGLAIPAHKLVLAVRCPLVLRDISSQRSDVTSLHVDVILWPEVSNDDALCFLEYVYYGSIRSIHTLREDMSGLRWLATRYEAKDLLDVLSYFGEKKRAVKSLSDMASLRSPTPDPTPDPAPLTISSRGSFCSVETMPIVKSVVENESDEDLFNDKAENNKESEHSIHSQRTAIPEERTRSPDIFSDEYEFDLSSSVKSGTGREDVVVRTQSFDWSVNHITTREERSSTVSSEKPDQFNKHLSPEKSFGLSNSSLPRKSTETPSLSPTKVIDLSPCSDVPEFEFGSQKSTNCSQRLVFPDDDVVVLSDDEDTAPAGQRQQNMQSMSTESRKSGASPSSGDEETPYISPVWNGFDDMPCDIDMESNWNDDPVSGISPVRDQSPARRRSTHNSSPDRIDIQDISPVRADILENSPACVRIMGNSSARASILGNSPARVNIRENSPARVNIRENSPARINICGNSPARASIPANSRVRGGYERTSSRGANKVHCVSDTASSEDESAPGIVGDDLLNDSMNAIFASSILEREEKKHLSRNTTTTKRMDDSSPESGRVTPMKNYRGMTTPELKVELHKYGLKPILGKKKGIKMLEYIYEQLHPWVPVDGSSTAPEATTAYQPSTQRLTSSQLCSKVTTNAQKGCSSSSSSPTSSSDEGLSDVELEDSDSGMVISHQGTKKLSASELVEVVSKHIEKDKGLHRKILEYEPIFIEHLYSDLKKNGYKFKISDLMAYLGEKCINYRSVKAQSVTRKNHKQNGNQRKNKRRDADSSDSNAGFGSKL